MSPLLAVRLNSLYNSQHEDEERGLFSLYLVVATAAYVFHTISLLSRFCRTLDSRRSQDPSVSYGEEQAAAEEVLHIRKIILVSSADYFAQWIK